MATPLNSLEGILVPLAAACMGPEEHRDRIAARGAGELRDQLPQRCE